MLDKRFKYKLGNTPIQRLYTGTLWAEGPAWNGVGRYLLWSDIPNNEQLRWLEEDGHVARRFRFPAGNSNGNTFDYQGRQIACEHGTRRSCATSTTADVTVLAEKFDGKQLNAPNDAVVHPNDGAIWFTDPGYGRLMDYEGNRLPASASSPSPPEGSDLSHRRPERCHHESGRRAVQAQRPLLLPRLQEALRRRHRHLALPEGEEHHLGLRRRRHEAEERQDIRRTWSWNGKTGFADGIRCDEDGNVWSSAGWVGDGYDGVHIFAPDGERIGQIRLPEICSNVCFGGTKRNRLFMTGSQSLYAVYVETRGAHIT